MKVEELRLARPQTCKTTPCGLLGRTPQFPRLLTPAGNLEIELGSVLVARATVGVWSMSTDFKPGDIVRHKSGGQDTIIIRLEDESVAGVTKKLAFCGRFEGQNFHQETIPLEMLEFVNRQFPR